MKYKYKVAKTYWPELEKKIKSCIRKLDKYGLSHLFEVGDTSVEYVTLYEYDEVGYCWVPHGVIATEVISYNFEMEEIKLGDWTPVASIEHNVGVIHDKSYNAVTMLNNNYSRNSQWEFIPPKCEHCNSNRRRNKTVILVNDAGEYKQVGTSCLKEFTGIDAEKIIGVYGEIRDKFISPYEMEPIVYSDRLSKLTKYIPTREYLARSIHLIDKYGYVKDIYTEHCTKLDAMNGEGKFNTPVEPNELDYDTAETIIHWFTKEFDNEFDTSLYSNYDLDFIRNIRDALANKFTKINGLVAYAPVFYDRLQADLIEYSTKLVSKWQGNIGDKIKIKLTLVNISSFESQFGCTRIYTFQDVNDNIYKWFTQNMIDVNENEECLVCGTIKSHEEYQKCQETILTRCKIYDSNSAKYKEFVI